MKGSTYNQLMIFITIVQEGSIRAAARKLEIAPPSVSQALKLLEQHFGLPLLNRTTRQMELTDAGRILYEQSSPLVTSLTTTVESILELSEIPSGKIRITIPRFGYQVFLKPIYAEFCRRYPEIELEVSVSDGTVNLISEGFDLGIRFGDKVEDEMVSLPLTPPMQDVLFASPEYLKEHGTPKKPDDLKHHKMTKYRYITSNKLAPINLLDKGQKVNIETPTATIVNDTDLLLDTALEGLSISRIVKPLAQPYFDDGRLVPVLQRYWNQFPGLHLYFPQHSQKARRIRVLIDYLAEHKITHW